MYIIVIGWLYVTVLMALTESSIVAGLLSLTFYGILPTALLVWLFGGPTRRRRAARMRWRHIDYIGFAAGPVWTWRQSGLR